MSKGIAIVHDRASSKKQEENYTRQDVKRIGFEIAERYDYATESEPRFEVKSGESLQNRPTIMAILKEIESRTLIEGKPIKAIIVPNFTRLSRDEDGIDGLIIRKICRDNNVVVIDFTGKVYDFEREHDQDAAFFEFWFAARDKRQIITTMTRGMKEKARQGKQMGRMAPLGYKQVPTATANRRGKVLLELEVMEEEAQLVRRIFRLYKETSAFTTVKTLNRVGVLLPIKNTKLVAKKNGGQLKTHRPFHVADVLRIISNPLYAGWVTWNIGRSKYHPKSKYMKDLEPQMHFDASLQIISQQEFDDVQTLVKERARVPPRTANSVYPFAYILRCANCGGPMNGSAGIALRRKMGKVDNSIYRCYTHWHNLSACESGQSIRTTIVAKAIIPFAAKLLGDFVNLVESLQNAAKEYSTETTLKQLEVATRAELEKTKKSIERIILSIGEGLIEETEARTALTELRDKKERLTRELVGLEERFKVKQEILEAVQILERDVEKSLWEIYKRKPQVLTRLMRLMFQPRSVVVESYAEGWNNYGGRVVGFNLTSDFSACVVSTSTNLHS